MSFNGGAHLRSLLARSPTFSRSLSYHSPPLSLSLALFQFHYRSLSITLILSHSSPSQFLSLSFALRLSHPLYLPLSLPLSRTRARTHSLSLFLSDTHTEAHARYLGVSRFACSRASAIREPWSRGHPCHVSARTCGPHACVGAREHARSTQFLFKWTNLSRVMFCFLV